MSAGVANVLCITQITFIINHLPHVLGSDTKILIQTQKYYSEQKQKQQLGVAENGEVGDKVPH